MRHRIRAAALLCDGERLLMVEHRSRHSGRLWWIPPGGGAEPGDSSIFACAVREVFEETGLAVSLSRIVYVREFFESSRNVRHLELFLLATDWSGEITQAHHPEPGPDDDIVLRAAWLTRRELDDRQVYPQELRTRFWDEFSQGFPHTVYLGVQTDKNARPQETV
jgi:8-oxo-dGTP diphosphatase